MMSVQGYSRKNSKPIASRLNRRREAMLAAQVWGRERRIPTRGYHALKRRTPADWARRLQLPRCLNLAGNIVSVSENRGASDIETTELPARMSGFALLGIIYFFECSIGTIEGIRHM